MIDDRTQAGETVILHRNPKSGHCHRVELMLRFLEIPYRTHDLDMANGAHKAPDYLAISPLGQVPAIEQGEVALADSNAICSYLVHRHGDAGAWLGRTPLEAAQVQRWLSIAAGEIAAGPCAARLATVFGATLDHAAAKARSHALFATIEAHLEGREWLAAERPTLADVAGYSYIAHAPEGGVSLRPYPGIRAWLSRIEGLANFIPMERSPTLA